MIKIATYAALLLSTVVVESQNQFNTPDVVSVIYIKNDGNFLSECQSSLSNTPVLNMVPIESLVGACLALQSSANNDPPDSFAMEADWDRWRVTQEYRGYIRIPSFSVSCDASGNVLSYNPFDPDYVDNNNPTTSPNVIPTMDQDKNPYGYTKAGGFQDPDIYAEPFNGISWSSSGSCLTVKDNRASRLSQAERVLQFGILGTDAPFAFTSVVMTACCNGKIDVSVYRSEIPTARLYINGVKVAEAYQSNFGDFIEAGGRPGNPLGLTPSGKGVLAPSGSSITWTSTPTSL